MQDQNYTHATFVLTTAGYPGYWSRGTTLAHAASQLKRAGARGADGVILRLVFNDPEPWVDENGALNYGGPDAPNAWQIRVGALGSLSAVIKANPAKK